MGAAVAESRIPSRRGEPWIIGGLEIPSFENASLEDMVHCIETFGFSSDKPMSQELDENGHHTCKYSVWIAIRGFVCGLDMKLIASKLSFSVVQMDDDKVHERNVLGLFQSAYDNLKAAGENEVIKEWLDVICPHWSDHLKDAEQDLTLLSD